MDEVATAPGQLEGHPRHPLDLGGGVDLGVDGALAATGQVLDEPGRAEKFKLTSRAFPAHAGMNRRD
jgi:hypothetical protein